MEEPPAIKSKRGKPKNSKGRNSVNRLVKYQNGALAFAFNQAIPFTNNQAGPPVRRKETLDA
ncbi:hypothetical protein [Runella sp.]|uniref:hypothetical protein n=1 Tax=Runella sp. TaxID=1960881 RepID=UPI00261A2993|nr:hypothetical protein [Runella sp.]